MRSNPIPMIAALMLVPILATAQDQINYELRLRSGAFTPAFNISFDKVNEFNQNSYKAAGKTFALIQFERIPAEEQKQEMRRHGIELLDYVPYNAYTVTITGASDVAFLLAMKARALLELTP